MKTFLTLIGSFLLATTTWAEPSQMYNDLALKDLDQMADMVKKKIKQSKQASSDKVGPLREALQEVFSRPDEDGMIDKVVGSLRSELDENEAWDTSLNALADEAINALKDPPKEMKANLQVTYAIFLQNLVGYLKPQSKADGFERTLLTKIRDAEIKVTKAARNERRVRSIKGLASPSETAARVLEGKQNRRKGDEFNN
jgi:hypothetical protein